MHLPFHTVKLLWLSLLGGFPLLYKYDLLYNIISLIYYNSLLFHY
jgi:hypothetical protein